MLARYWAANPPGFDYILSSPLVRAERTARIIAEELGMPVETSDLWMEFDNGPFAGRPFAEIRDRYPTPDFRSRWDPLTGDGGESVAAFDRRADAALQQTLDSGKRTPLVVAHGGILNAALRNLFGATSARFFFEDTTFAQVALGPTTDVATLITFGRPHIA